jgi:hypothetical protein
MSALTFTYSGPRHLSWLEPEVATVVVAEGVAKE